MGLITIDAGISIIGHMIIEKIELNPLGFENMLIGKAALLVFLSWAGYNAPKYFNTHKKRTISKIVLDILILAYLLIILWNIIAIFL